MPEFRRSFRSCLSLAVLAGLLLARPALAQTATAPESHRWGVNDDHIVTGPAPDEQGQLPPGDVLLQARQAGLGWARYVLFWFAVNPAQGTYQWDAPDREIARLRAAGFNVLVHVAYPPAWTTGARYANQHSAFWCLDEQSPDGVKQGQPGSDEFFNCRDSERRPGYRAPGQPPLADRSADFRTFVDAAVRRYQGQVKAWSFGMEVHNQVFWRGSIRQLMDEVLRPGYEVVKAVDPGLLVAGPDEDVEASYDAVMAMEAADIASGKGRVFDVLAFHAFNHSGWDTPEKMDRKWRNGGWGDCQFETPGMPPSCSMRGIAEHYAKGRPVWLTEFGYQADSAADANAGAWLANWIDGIKARPWIDKAFFYRLRQDDGVKDFGLFAAVPPAPGTPAPAATAVRSRLATQALPEFSYLAEGAVADFFDLDVLVANPNPQPAPVKLTFLRDDGAVETLADTLPATSRRTYAVGRTAVPALATARGVSTLVESTLGLPLAVERTMFWDRTGYYGGHTGSAVAEPATRWYFGEGSQGFFDTYVLLANSGNTDAHVTVTFLLDGEGLAPVVGQVQVPARTRSTIGAMDYPELADKSFAIIVDADAPIIAERAMYFGQVPFWAGGHESAGVTALSRTWLLAEGATGTFFDNYVLVGNPGETDAEVTFTFLLANGSVVVGTPHRENGATGLGRVGARSRFTLDVENAGLRLDVLAGDPAQLSDAAVSVKVEASEPVVVERAMYWPGNFTTWAEAHNSFGITETGTRWGLAEGRNGGPRAFETYILVANPSDQDATVTVTFLLPDGTTQVLDRDDQGSSPLVVKGNSRYTVPPWQMPSGEFGAVVESTSGAPIVVERAMYWTPPGGTPWAGGSNATAVRLR